MTFKEAVAQKRVAAELAYKRSKPPEEWTQGEMDDAVHAAIARGIDAALHARDIYPYDACDGCNSPDEMSLAAFENDCEGMCGV